MSIEIRPRFDSEGEAFVPETETDKAGKVRRFFGHCFEITGFDEGDRIPVGGENRFSTDTNIEVRCDFENLRQFLGEAHEFADKVNVSKVKEWLGSQGIEFDEKLFAILFAFTKKFEETYPDTPERSDARLAFYSEKGREFKLSDIFNANIAECAEIAALAQVYLQQEDVPATYFSGDVLWNKEHEFSGEHSFVIIRQGEKTYIYDPTNPVDSTSGKFPSIYITKVDFDDQMATMQKRFVTAVNILSKKEAFFGTNNGTNVRAESHIV